MTVVKFPNENKPIYGACGCGSQLFMLRLSGDRKHVTHVCCAGCESEESVELEPEFE